MHATQGKNQHNARTFEIVIAERNRVSAWCATVLDASEIVKNVYTERDFRYQKNSAFFPRFLIRFAFEWGCRCARFFIIYYCIAHRFFSRWAFLLTAQERFVGSRMEDVEKRSSYCWTLLRCSLDCTGVERYFFFFLFFAHVCWRDCMMVESVWLIWWRLLQWQWLRQRWVRSL